MSESRRFRVEGKVQGVWFRESTRQQAEMRGISGHARNCPDGSVEVVASGTPEAISALRAWLQQGPPMASVTSVVEWPFDGPVDEGFVTG